MFFFLISSVFQFILLPAATGASLVSCNSDLVRLLPPCCVEFDNVSIVARHLCSNELRPCRRRSGVTCTFTAERLQLLSLVLKNKQCAVVVSLMRYDVPENNHTQENSFK
uniref:Putative secreted protein n=1 Tax=Ixodes ricinus TaxID=34613 RepID=A0A6B0UIZ3_IXORI